MKALKPASSKPTPNPETTDKSKLQATIDQAKALDLSGYTKKSAQAVRDALAKAQSVLADDNATQADIDAAQKWFEDRGFEFNEDLKNAYLKCYPFKFEGWQFNTGDGIKMVEDVGAKLWHMDMAISMYSMWTRDPENDFSILYFMPANSYFNVNRLGKRYVNENNMGSPHNGWHTLLSFDDSIADFDRIPSWGIFDQSCFDAGKLSTSQGDFFECGNFASDLPDSVRDWDGWSQDNKAELERGWILTGATIEELGQKIKEFDPLMDVDTLKATFEEYQGFAAAGKDARFDRAAETMVPLDNGPYYAVSIYPGSCSTLGGPMKNEHGQVLDPAENPIPRLYAAGCFGNFQSHSYGITGGNNAENQVWGRISARHAAGLEPWDAK